jgi:transposase
LNWRAKVELYEGIRREYEFGVGTIRGVARKLGVHRRMVREAVGNAMPVPRKKPKRSYHKLGSVIAIMDRMLEEDRKAPRKQRHTAHRIWQRLRSEVVGFEASERAVRQYVRRRKAEMGWTGRETCVPQSHPWGEEGQVDWYEAWAELGGERTKLQVFSMRSMASGGAFHRAYLRATQQAFLEAHELAFAYFRGGFRRLRYDNLGAAVKKILRGNQREETARFMAFRSHWRFESEFCTPAVAHEKGGIEEEVGYFRRNHWVPIPKARDVEELNAQLLEGCRQDQQRRIAGQAQCVGIAMGVEQEYLLPLTEEGFDLAELSYPTVDGMGRVKVRTNFYSVPLCPGTVVQAKIHSALVALWYEGKCVARHERCYGHQQQILDLEHYLEVLERKPGALAGSKPLEQWRKLGRWTDSYDRFWQQLMLRHGKSGGTRQMIELIGLGKEQGYDRLKEGVNLALSLGCWDVAAVRHLLLQERLDRPRMEAIEVGLLGRYERPLPLLDDYDRLLNWGGAS